MRYLTFLFFVACTGPRIPEAHVTIVVPPELQADAAYVATQFAFYGPGVDVVGDMAEVPDDAWPVDFTLVPRGSVQGRDIAGEVYSAMENSSDGSVWMVDDMSPSITRSTMLHEMCHAFGAPSRPSHWTEPGGCADEGATGVLTQLEKDRFVAIWKEM